MPVPLVDLSQLGEFLYKSVLTSNDEEDDDVRSRGSGEGRADSPGSPESYSTVDYEASNEACLHVRQGTRGE